MSFPLKATSGLPTKGRKFLRSNGLISAVPDQMEDELLSVPAASGSLPRNLLEKKGGNNFRMGVCGVGGGGGGGVGMVGVEVVKEEKEEK